MAENTLTPAVDGNQIRFVQLYSWWQSTRGRQFCVVEKLGKSPASAHADQASKVYQTTLVKLIEVGDPNPINYAVDEFWRLVDRGSLIEMKPA